MAFFSTSNMNLYLPSTSQYPAMLIYLKASIVLVGVLFCKLECVISLRFTSANDTEIALSTSFSEGKVSNDMTFTNITTEGVFNADSGKSYMLDDDLNVTIPNSSFRSPFHSTTSKPPTETKETELFTGSHEIEFINNVTKESQSTFINRIFPTKAEVISETSSVATKATSQTLLESEDPWEDLETVNRKFTKSSAQSNLYVTTEASSGNAENAIQDKTISNITLHKSHVGESSENPIVENTSLKIGDVTSVQRKDKADQVGLSPNPNIVDDLYSEYHHLTDFDLDAYMTGNRVTEDGFGEEGKIAVRKNHGRWMEEDDIKHGYVGSTHGKETSDYHDYETRSQHHGEGHNIRHDYEWMEDDDIKHGYVGSPHGKGTTDFSDYETRSEHYSEGQFTHDYDSRTYDPVFDVDGYQTGNANEIPNIHNPKPASDNKEPFFQEHEINLSNLDPTKYKYAGEAISQDPWKQNRHIESQITHERNPHLSKNKDALLKVNHGGLDVTSLAGLEKKHDKNKEIYAVEDFYDVTNSNFTDGDPFSIQEFYENYNRKDHNSVNPGERTHFFGEDLGDYAQYSAGYDTGNYYYDEYYYGGQYYDLPCVPQNNLCSTSELLPVTGETIDVRIISEDETIVSGKEELHFTTRDPSSDLVAQGTLATPTKSANVVDLGLRVVCNASVQLQSVSLMTEIGCSIRTTEVIIHHQMSLCRISSNELSSFHNVTYFALTDSGLQIVEDGAFGLLKRLHTLDLRNNQLTILSWRALGHDSLLGEHLYHLNVSGNPLDFHECKNAWLVPWRSLSSGRKSWREADGDDEEVADRGDDDISESLEESTEGNRTIIASSEYCSDPEFANSQNTSSPECYLCPANLTVLTGNSETGHGQCLYTLVRCSAKGYPLPWIEWDVPKHLIVVEVQANKTDNFTYTSTINVTYTSTGKEYDYPPLACTSMNDRYLSKEQIDLSIQEETSLPPQICRSQFKTEYVYEKFKYVAQAAPPVNLTWWYYPCSGHPVSPFTGEGLEHHYNFTEEHSSYFQGYLRFPDKVGGGKRLGHYELQITNAHGTANVSYFLNQRPKPSPPCQRGDAYQFTPTLHGHPNPDHFPPRPPQVYVPCVVTTTQSTPTPVPPSNATTPPTISPVPQLLPLPITLTISACILVFGITLVFVVLKNIFWKRDRPNMENDPCPDSPFQITFIGCLCRDDECQKKTEGLQVEMMPLRADRLVENPEYLGNGNVTPSKPQARVIPRDKVKFVAELGEGAFGIVYLGILEEGWGRTTQVAVKTLKTVGAEARQELEREVELLNNFKHNNIVSFYGVCYNSDPLLMVFEYMEHGDLNNYLRSHNEDVALLTREETPTSEPLTVMDCLQVALQIAAGMKYLASQHYIHRDLATRNCLVGANLVVKIGDFGMSRDVYTNDYYQFGGRALLPVRWMPPESILYRRFTIESDIWSFGVVLWEIFTGGKQPWYGYTNQEVIKQITAGKMLSCPEKCPPDMYRIMLSCWSKNPQERLPMATLYDRICSLTTVEPHVLDYD